MHNLFWQCCRINKIVFAKNSIFCGIQPSIVLIWRPPEGRLLKTSYLRECWKFFELEFLCPIDSNRDYPFERKFPRLPGVKYFVILISIKNISKIHFSPFLTSYASKELFLRLKNIYRAVTPFLDQRAHRQYK